MSKRVLHVLECRKNPFYSAHAGTETYHIISEGRSVHGPITRTNKATQFDVYAERQPDEQCPHHVEIGKVTCDSVVAANATAHKLAKNIACGRAVKCPGLSACIDGAPCPYELK